MIRNDDHAHEPILSDISNDPTVICGGVFIGINGVLRTTCIAEHRETYREALTRVVTACVVSEPPSRVLLTDILTPGVPADYMDTGSDASAAVFGLLDCVRGAMPWDRVREQEVSGTQRCIRGVQRNVRFHEL